MKKLIYIFLFSIFALLVINVTSSYSQGCGPGPHWVDSCRAGTDTINCSSFVILGIEFPQNDCLGPFVTFIASSPGPTIVRRDPPVGHTIQTELVSLSLTGTFMGFPTTVTVGAGSGLGPLGNLLQPTFGQIIELGNTTDALSFFDVMYEVCINIPPPTGPIYLYNHIPHRIQSVIDRVPPLCPFTHTSPTTICSGLFTDPRPGQGQKIANVIARDHALPVELASFNSSINERNVTLNWTTATEENNSGFEIERSNVKGQTSNDWTKIGFVNGQGNSNVANNYSFEDRNLSSGRYNYRLKQIDYNGNFQYFDLQNEVVIGVPEKFYLSQNYPNPFNPATKINYDIPKDGIVKLIIYDNNGREVKTLVNEFKNAGYYTTDFEAANLPSGAYFYKLESNNFVATKKMVILK